MARPKGSTNKPKTPPAEAKAGPGHNSETMSDDNRQKLFFSHRAAYVKALAKKKETDAAFRNVCKLAKAELGDGAVDDLKTAILLESDEGEAEVRARIERQLRVARWLALPLGLQVDLFQQPDRQPAVDRAFAEGKRDGLAGLTLNNPYSSDLPQADHYARGWHDGQQVNGAGIKSPEDKDLRPPFLQREDQSLADVPATAFE